MTARLAKPDDSYLIDAGRAIKALKDPEGLKLLDDAVTAYGRCDGTNLRDAQFRNAERRLRSWLFGREMKKTIKTIRKKQTP